MRLKELREAAKLTQRETANAIGCGQSAYSRYEIGERLPPVELLTVMADFFQVSTDFLLGRDEGDSLVLTPAERELVLASRAADKRARQDALALLEAHNQK